MTTGIAQLSKLGDKGIQRLCDLKRDITVIACCDPSKSSARMSEMSGWLSINRINTSRVRSAADVKRTCSSSPTCSNGQVHTRACNLQPEHPSLRRT